MRLDARLSMAAYWVSTALTLGGAGLAFWTGHYGWGLAIVVIAGPMLAVRQVVLRVVEHTLQTVGRDAAPRPPRRQPSPPRPPTQPSTRVH